MLQQPVHDRRKLGPCASKRKLIRSTSLSGLCAMSGSSLLGLPCKCCLFIACLLSTHRLFTVFWLHLAFPCISVQEMVENMDSTRGVCSSLAYCKCCLLKYTLSTQLFILFWLHLTFSCVSLQEMVENMDSTRDVWAMQLDTIRNRIIRVELLVAVASFSLMMSTVPASFFGMNLTSGLEVMPCHMSLVLSQLTTFCSSDHTSD